MKISLERNILKGRKSGIVLRLSRRDLRRTSTDDEAHHRRPRQRRREDS